MADSDPKRKVAFYIRVSTERQAKVEEGSLKNQHQMLQAELERRNIQQESWGAFVKAYVDDGVSAKTTNRPAFQRLMRDIEIGRIDTVMFTELSRLSRSLKDFLNIFEFSRKHTCDLVCLKTEIDTTSPYQGLVTKILMVFAEFEREMTSRRTALNAYERSKRGLANGGRTLLGYRRDRRRKGYLIVAETEAEVVRAIFKTYVQEKSIRRTTDRIGECYQGRTPRLKRITPGKVYGILTNKAYIGIREIHKRDQTRDEEVEAVWEPIIGENLFRQAQAMLQANKDRYHRRGCQRYTYLLSGLLCCGKCGEKLQGKSAYSSADKRHRYYSHRSTCPKGGLNRIDAEVAQRLVLDWIEDIASNGEKFRELEEKGRERIGRQIIFLQDSLKKLDGKEADLREQIETRIQELTKARAEVVRNSIEQSIVDLEKRKKDLAEKRTYVNHSIQELKGLIAENADLFKGYSQRIREVLNQSPEQLKTGLQGLLSYLILEERYIKTALSAVNLKGPVSAVFAFAPPVRLELTTW